MRQMFDGFGKRHAQRLFDEFENVAVFAASETMVESFLVADGEGGRLFMVERTASPILVSLAFQFDDLTDDADDRNAGRQFLQKRGRKKHDGLFGGQYVFDDNRSLTEIHLSRESFA